MLVLLIVQYYGQELPTDYYLDWHKGNIFVLSKIWIKKRIQQNAAIQYKNWESKKVFTLELFQKYFICLAVAILVVNRMFGEIVLT